MPIPRIPKAKDPALENNPGIPRAPAGMETDPETGDVAPNDVTKGLKPNPKPKKAQADVFKVTFPNMEKRAWSVRPHFTHNWFKDVKIAAVREGGQIVTDDPGSIMVSFHFRTARAARDFTNTVVSQYYVPVDDVMTSMLHTSQKTFKDLQEGFQSHTQGQEADVSPEEVITRALDQADAHQIQAWMNENGFGPGELAVDIAPLLSPASIQSLHAAVLDAETGSRSLEQGADDEEGDDVDYEQKEKLLFDPTQYVKASGESPIYHRNEPTLETFETGDEVLTMDEEEVLVGTVARTIPFDQVYVDLGDDNVKLFPRTHVSKIVYFHVPFSEFNGHIQQGQIVKLAHNGIQLKVSRLGGHPNRLKVSTLNDAEHEWVPTESLTVMVRTAKLPNPNAPDWI